MAGVIMRDLYQSLTSWWRMSAWLAASALACQLVGLSSLYMVLTAASLVAAVMAYTSNRKWDRMGRPGPDHAMWYWRASTISLLSAVVSFVWDWPMVGSTTVGLGLGFGAMAYHETHKSVVGPA